MGQSLSRRPPPPPTSMSASTPVPGHANNTCPPRHSLPRRIFSSLPKPSLGSRPFSSLALPTRPEQTLRSKKRRWGLPRRRSVAADIKGTASEHVNHLTEHDEHHDDRDVDEFGVITHRVLDSHSDSQAASAKGKERARDANVEDDNEDCGLPTPSSSAVPPTQSCTRTDHIDDDRVIIAPTVPPSPPLQRIPSPTLPESEHLNTHPPSVPATPPLSSSPIQPSSNSPRPFPPPGTLVVVQGVVHTTDVPRSSERPVAVPNPIPHDAFNPNINYGPEVTSMEPSPLPTGTRPRSPLSGILARPTSMASASPSSLPLNSIIDSSTVESQAQQVTPDTGGTIVDSSDEDRTHARAHGISMAQGPVGASGLSASSIDVLGTLLSVAAAATAASLLTGSSEPIFSSGLTSSQSLPSSGSTQSAGFSPNVPSERPLSPTPTSDAGRMRHVWSSLRDRLGLGSGAPNSSNPGGTSSSSGSGQSVLSQPSDVIRPRDPREIMLTEMARAFNLGLGLGGATPTPSTVAAASSLTPEVPIQDDDEAPAGDRDGEQSSLPPPDSFERFLMDLQTDLRVTLMQEQDSSVPRRVSQDANETTEDVEEDQLIPELRSLSDSDSEEFEARRFGSDNEEEPDCERHADEDGDEGGVHTTQEQFGGRTSATVSAPDAGIQSLFGLGAGLGSASSFYASGTSLAHTAPPHPVFIAGSSNDVETGVNNSATEGTHAAQVSSGVNIRIGTDVPVDESSPSEMWSEEGPEGRRTGAVLGEAHSLEASNGGRRVEAEGGRAGSGVISVPPHGSQDASNAPETGTGQELFLPGTSPLSIPLAYNTPNSLPGGSATTAQDSIQPSASALPLFSDSERNSSATIPTPADSSMPFRLPFAPSSASRTEHTPGGGINWWRMYRFPAVASPNLGQLGGPQGSLPPLSQSPFRMPAQGPSHTSPWARTTGQNEQNEMITPRGVPEVPGVHSGPAVSTTAPSVTTTGLVSTPIGSTSAPLPTNGEDSNPSTNTSINPPEHRTNIVVPVIVVGLQSVNMDRQPAQPPLPHTNYTPTIDDDGEGADFDSLEQSMSMPLHIPEPPEFRHHSTSLTATQQGQGGQQPARGRTWQSRAANAIRNLRPSRRNVEATSPQPQEIPGSRTFLIYVIGGYYPPDHQIITGGNLDSFEALWELAELLGQVKPPTVSKEEIERSGLEIVKASLLEEYEKQGRIASNCVDKCLICLDDYSPEDELRVLTCKHAFHQACVDRWLETGRNNCPACRTKGVPNQDP